MTEELMNSLNAEELEPRLELQVLVDPLASLTTATNNNCAAGGNCQVQK